MSPAAKRVELQRLRRRFQKNLSLFQSAESQLARLVAELRVVDPDHAKLPALECADNLVGGVVTLLGELVEGR